MTHGCNDLDPTGYDGPRKIIHAAQLLAAAIPFLALAYVLATPAVGFMWDGDRFTLAWNEVVATVLGIALAVQAVRVWPTSTTVAASVLSAGIGISALLAAAM